MQTGSRERKSKHNLIWSQIANDDRRESESEMPPEGVKDWEETQELKDCCSVYKRSDQLSYTRADRTKSKHRQTHQQSRTSIRSL